jgi:hypothetical protein
MQDPVSLRLPDFGPLEPKTTVADAVAAVAFARGVSERTVWRWLAQMQAKGTQELPPRQRHCARCGGALPAGATLARRYCDNVCRVYAWRERKQLLRAPAR